MLAREEVIGQRIAEIVGDSSFSDDEFNSTDFLYVLANGIAIRMPCDDKTGNLLPQATVTPNHQPLDWPPDPWGHFQFDLWNATIADIQVPRNREERFPDGDIILLSSGWYLTQIGGAPRGIVPYVRLHQDSQEGHDLISVWDTTP